MSSVPCHRVSSLKAHRLFTNDQAQKQGGRDGGINMAGMSAISYEGYAEDYISLAIEQGTQFADAWTLWMIAKQLVPYGNAKQNLLPLCHRAYSVKLLAAQIFTPFRQDCQRQSNRMSRYEDLRPPLTNKQRHIIPWTSSPRVRDSRSQTTL